VAPKTEIVNILYKITGAVDCCWN